MIDVEHIKRIGPRCALKFCTSRIRWHDICGMTFVKCSVPVKDPVRGEESNVAAALAGIRPCCGTPELLNGTSGNTGTVA